MLGSAESEMVTLIAVKLFSQNSNVYDHDTSTSHCQTDGIALAITALRIASRGKNATFSAGTGLDRGGRS